MPQVFSLPADNQEAFRRAVMAAQSRRGDYLTEAEMLGAAETMGAPDPFPIGMAFSNQVPVTPPKTRAQVGRANQREDMNRRLAEREAGIRAYEAQTGKRDGQDQIESARARALKEGRGIMPDQRAEYILRQRENESARNRALAAAQQYIDSQPTAMMRLEDYRDPQGAFERRMQERAFGLAEQRQAGESADRADALGIRRDALDIEREKIASGERLAGDAEQRADARDARKEDLQFRVLELQQRLEDARADRNANLTRELQTEKIKADRDLAQLEADTANKKIVPPDKQAAMEAIINDTSLGIQEKLAMIATLNGGKPQPASSEAPIYPNMQGYLQGLSKDNNSIESLLDNINVAAADSPAEQELVKRFLLQTYGADAFRKFADKKEYDFGWLRNMLGNRGYATQKQNRKRGLVGLPPNAAEDSGIIHSAAGHAAMLNPVTAPTSLFIKAMTR